MKKSKSLKLMFLGLLALGLGTAYAVDPVTEVGPEVGETITVDNYVYTVTKRALSKNNAIVSNGTVEMTEVAEGGQTVDANESLIFDEDGQIEWTIGNKVYTFDITTMDPDLFRDNSYGAKHAVIPASFTEIPTGAFNTLTNLYDLTFAEGSQVTKIGTQAFASTQISTFDFSPCTKLEGLQDGVFVQTTTEEAGKSNVNANITTIILPTSTAFKHINGAFRNLTALTTITNLDNSWVRELVDGAFSGCAALKTLSLPGNDLQYISSKALEGSAIEDLTVNVGGNATNGNPLKLLGGCTVAYVFREATQDYVYNYEGNAYTEACEEAIENEEMTEGDVVAWDDDTNPADAQTNLYGKAVVNQTPLRKLTLVGTLQGKICKNAFAWSNYLADDTKATVTVEDPELVVSGLFFGSKAQIETNAFKDCTGLTELTLNDINDNKLDAGEYTIEADAFENCPIATLNLGNIMTNNAIGSKAFGVKLKNVTIKTVKAASQAFEAGVAAGDNADGKKGAFVFDYVSGATLNLATGEGEYVSSDNPDANNSKIIPYGTFDFTAIDATPKVAVLPVINIGEIKSQGGVFAANSILGKNVNVINFTGDINTNGLDVAILAGGEDAALSTLTFAGAIKTNGIGEGAFTNFPNLAALSFAGLLSKEAVASGAFTGSGKVGADGNIGTDTTPFVTYTADLTANDASENPFASDAFGAADADRIIYWSVANATLSASIQNAIQKDVEGDNYVGETVNPKFNVYKWVAIVEEEKDAVPAFIVFTDNKEIALDQNTDATLAWGRYDLGSFEKEGTVAGQELTATDMVIKRYQTTTDVDGNSTYNVLVTLYGMYWDQDENGRKSSVYMVPLEVINGEYWIPADNEHLIIAKVKNLDGEFAEDQILVNYVPGELTPATYSFDSYASEDAGEAWAEGGEVEVVSTTEDGWTIVKVTDNGEGPENFVGQQFAVHATDLADVDEGDRLQLYTYANGEIGDAIENVWVEVELEDAGGDSQLEESSVWDQLTRETAGEGPVKDPDDATARIKRIFEKADHSWTNQELVDEVTNEGGAQTIADKDLHVLLDPSVNAGFDVKRLVIERKTDGTGAYIGKNWYYALLNNYGNAGGAARVIWLDYEQATAIFGVKAINANAEGNNNNAIYNLQGIRVEKATKGIYIQNGKKIVVK